MSETLDAFNKLHVTIRSFVIAVILLTPFWYFDLYLFKKGFVSHDYIQLIPSIAAFCLSLVWIAASAISCFFSVMASSEGKGFQDDNGVTIFSVLTVSFSVLHLGTYTYFAHLWKWEFYKFLNYTYLIVICRIVLWVTLTIINSPKNKK